MPEHQVQTGLGVAEPSPPQAAPTPTTEGDGGSSLDKILARRAEIAAAQQAASEPAPPSRADVPLAKVVGLGEDVTRTVTEINQPAAVAAAQDVQNFTRDVQEQAENDNMQRDFMVAVAAARNPEPKPYTPPPIPERIAEATRLEMEAGRRRVSEFAAIEAARPKPQPQAQPGNATMTPVFRPADFVPDQKKGQGNIASDSARTL